MLSVVARLSIILYISFLRGGVMGNELKHRLLCLIYVRVFTYEYLMVLRGFSTSISFIFSFADIPNLSFNFHSI